MKKEKKKALKERTKNSANKFQKEFRKSTITAITAAFGFLIALVWRDVIQEIFTQIATINPIKGKLISAIIITFLAVLGMMIVSKFAIKE